MAGRTAPTPACGTRRSGWRGSPPISGFDCLWSAEHHFNDYSFVPDNLQLMTYLTGAVPEHRSRHRRGHPALARPAARRRAGGRARHAEQGPAAARPRARPGAARVRRLPRCSMDESRERFDEAAPMIVNALQAPALSRATASSTSSRASRSGRGRSIRFDGRIYAVASSEDSVDSAAKLGAHMVMFADRPWEMRLPAIERGRELHRKYPRHRARRTIMLTEFCVCGTNLAETEEAGAPVPWANSSRATSTTTNSSASTSRP